MKSICEATVSIENLDEWLKSTWWSDWLQMFWQLWKTDLHATVGRTPSHTALKFRDEIICSLRHLCLHIQQTFIENILCARDWMKPGPCLEDLIVGETGMNLSKHATMYMVLGVWKEMGDHLRGNLKIYKNISICVGLEWWVEDGQVKK